MPGRRSRRNRPARRTNPPLLTGNSGMAATDAPADGNSPELASTSKGGALSRVVAIFGAIAPLGSASEPAIWDRCRIPTSASQPGEGRHHAAEVVPIARTARDRSASALAPAERFVIPHRSSGRLLQSQHRRRPGQRPRPPDGPAPPGARRRGGRVVEGARLESVYTGNRIAGSNPAPSATQHHHVTDNSLIVLNFLDF